ncbi:uncharacterized protein BDV14DRAFT_26855 [Aspergillus stella-maris]|uniref:uncharacterized protein n=1 Tax=Aspergillus stella-maris TaxID=1810926 RepID=UPI003CCCD95D
MSAKYRLRKSKSTRFSRTSNDHYQTSEPFDPELARLFATAAASRAMAMSRSAERPTTLSESSYGRLGGPNSMAVPPRRYKRSSYQSGESQPADDLPIQHSVSPSVEGSENDQPWSTALPSISEFGALDDRIASLPSSYRRLRKSRSMFSTRQRASHTPYGVTSPESYSPSISSRGPGSDPPRLYRTLRRSMSFLKTDPNPQSQNTLRRAKSQDISIQLARSQYQQNLLNSPDTQNWPPLSMSKVRREHKPFRKTFRATSCEGSSITDGSVNQVKVSQSHGRARAFSTTIKKGIKRVLGLSRNTSGQSKLHASPASSQHWGQSPAPTASDENHYSGDPDSFSIDQVPEREERSRQSTIRRMQSSGSIATSRSRVTSWADSTAANTIATPRVSGQERLSIISEQGIISQIDAPPLPSGSMSRGPGAVDSHRLFSALMKRIGGANAHAPDEDVAIGHIKEHQAIPTQGSSRFHRSRHTIRQVPSDVSISSPRSFATANPGPATPFEQPESRAAPPSRGASRPTETAVDDGNLVQRDSLRGSSISPSVYSRTTNGHSLQSIVAADSPDSPAEPGVATIYASERTAYSSPNKLVDTPEVDSSRQTGTDWQSWMDSQMARIENSASTRHYREDAEINDYPATNFTSAVPTRRIRVGSRGVTPAGEHEELSRRVSTNSNFSRPFSRSSSLRTVVKARETSPTVPTPSMPPLMADDVFRGSGGQEHFLKSAQSGHSSNGVSPMLSRSSNQPRIPDSPTPKRPSVEASPIMGGGKYGQYSSKWSPGSQEARLLHRRSARFLRENRRVTNENAKLESGMYDQAAGLQSPMSSKRMVEIFLDSRRRQMEGGNDSSPEPAFL